jgi:hypothetical protein
LNEILHLHYKGITKLENLDVRAPSFPASYIRISSLRDLDTHSAIPRCLSRVGVSVGRRSGLHQSISWLRGTL